jgi:hypothetical protein
VVIVIAFRRGLVGELGALFRARAKPRAAQPEAAD